MSIGEVAMTLADNIEQQDERYQRFWNYVPVPKLMEADGFYGTDRKYKGIFGANRSAKTYACIFEDIMIYTGIIPPSMQGLYHWEDKLKALTTGPNRRPRFVRIIVMDFAEHWPVTIEPMLTDPILGMLPEAWSDFNPEQHIFRGPDGSILDIFSADPSQKIDERKLRGPRIDHTHIDEINREEIFNESKVRSAAHADSPGTTSLSYCPQEGFDWTYDIFFKACYERRGGRSVRKPIESCDPDIYSVKLTMKDNPSITPEEYERQKRGFKSWEVAFRVDGEYSSRTSDAYFDIEPLIKWEEEERCSPGIPAIVDELEVDTETGAFKGDITSIEETDVQENGTYDEVHHPVWRIWELPEDGAKYVLSADIAEGNEKSDPHSASVWKAIDEGHPKQVAQLHMRLIKPGSFGIQCACMANAYGDCLLVPEANNTGGGMFIDRVRNYSNFYSRIRLEDEEEKQTTKLGWFTSAHSKGPMLDNAYKMLGRMAAEKKVLGQLPGGRDVTENYCPFNSIFSLKEFASYEEKLEKDKHGINRTTWGPRPGAKDDCTMEAVIAWRIIAHEFSKLSTCRIARNLIKQIPDNHYLGEKPRQTRAFSSWKKQPKMSAIRARHGGGYARASRHSQR